MDNFIECWNGLDDPRCGNAALHDFHEILTIALCAVLCGAQSSVEMSLFAKSKESFLRSFLKMENGAPSHDTFSRLFRMMDPEAFRAAFQRFMESFARQCEGVVAIDGKVLRRSFDKASGKSPLHMVSAWGCEHPGAGPNHNRRQVERIHGHSSTAARKASVTSALIAKSMTPKRSFLPSPQLSSSPRW